tara:strand:+ start:13688 stop:14146 length:459 start_codon:yes stop_codon:yes gene_type:complete
MQQNKPLLIGVGQDFRGDDAMGLLLVRKLKPILSSVWDLVESNGDGTLLMELWKDRECVYIIDAVSGPKEPGELYHFSAHESIPPADWFRTSTHHWGIAEAIEMSRVLQTLPKALFFWGIEGRIFTHSDELSPEVNAAMEELEVLLLQHAQL